MSKVLDMCCGGRMFYYQPNHPDVTFCDIRQGTFDLGTYPTNYGQRERTIKVDPDVICDFRDLPFENNSFDLVVFDPPHLISAGKNSWLAKKYGVLNKTWSSDIVQGFNEAMRVLRAGGTLIFKWSDEQIPVTKVLKSIDFKPLFGDKRGKTRWLVFFKSNYPDVQFSNDQMNDS
ncbi:class I SAM-dependent methyltransferase [Bombilactobacillus folatiphilus]|uniref:Class I SAM-dependent methyltransferase n=1 Tax=Bombilactobacillus folatiphilus TaxID=2923362 RepID=A0ABY4PA95_9LACO|nr:class I SAM-dependent methyltransferase [Bombilactobacillus folatiphilus]UQS82592.1 class I SAM-dependent methyltransferase [Bombilactobacillus folatiphilus]